jgi:hypothetical protein
MQRRTPRWLFRTLAFAAAVTVTLSSLRVQAAPGDFTARASSPDEVTSVTVNPNTNIVYAQQNGGTGFYSYNPTTNTWTTLASSPISSGNNGGAAYANGKIYTVYTNNDTQMGVYDIATNTWTTIANQLEQGTGNITSIGNDLYLAVEQSFVKYNVVSGIRTPLADPPIMDAGVGFEEWGGLEPYNGYIYGHQGNGYGGFARYDIANNSWTVLPDVPTEDAVLDENNIALMGSAIDPVNGIYYTYGGYEDDNFYAYNIANNTWSTVEIPLYPADSGSDDDGVYGNGIDDGGMVYISTPDYQGIYLTQGESGTGFARFETSIVIQSTYNSSVNGSGTLANTGGKVKTSFYGAYNKNGLGGAVSWTDKINNVTFKSTQVTAIVVNGNGATLYGVGTLNGESGVSFVLTTQDNFPTFFGRGDYVSFETAGYSFAGTFNPGDSKVTGSNV